MQKIIKFITERVNQDPEVNMARIEEIPFSIETAKTNGWLQPFVVVCLDAPYIETIYGFIGGFAASFDSITTNISVYTNNNRAYATVEIMYNE